tara:strand:- start:2009 stop:3091 length:1083 start_codon:yes stop_codon:yes gene_type:complete
MASITQTHKQLSGADKYTDTTIVTTGAFLNGNGTLLGGNMYNWTGSGAVTESQEYFRTIASSIDDATSTTKYFDVAYGNVNGLGSRTDNKKKSTRAVYEQWRNAALFTPHEKFKFKQVSGADGTETDDIWVFSLKNDQMKDGVSTKWSMTMVATGSGGTHTMGGGNVTNATLHLTTTGSWQNYPSRLGNYYRVVSGSAGVAHDGTSSQLTYGHFYPETGTVILSGDVMSGSSGLPGNSSTGSSGFTPDSASDGTSDNALRMISALQGGSISMRTYQYLNQTTYYCRLNHHEFNFTSNPTIIKSGSTTGEILDDFQNTPTTYVTELGLYNNNDSLIAVASLNKPVQKTPSNEVIVAAKVDG